MIINGKTPEGKIVFGDIFKYSGTHGLPLEVILDNLKSLNAVVDWYDYITSALADGHKINTIKSRIIAAIGDAYGSKYREKFAEKLEKLIKDMKL